MWSRSSIGIILALWLAETTQSFETAMIYAAQRALTDELGDPVKVGWLITGYLLIGAGAAAVAGRLGDIFGRRRLLNILLICAACGSLLSALAPNYPVLLIGRCLQGITGAIFALCVGLVRENLPPERVPMGIGLMVSGASAGTASGLVVGGLIVDHFSWHAVFVASAALAVISLTAVLLTVPRSPRSAGSARIDWFGGILFVPAVFAILAAITYGPSWGLGDRRTLTFLFAGVLLIALWIRASLRSPHPLFNVRLFANRAVLVTNGVTALVAMSTLQIALLFSLLLQAPKWTMIGLGVSATVAGLIKLPSNMSSLFGGPLSGWLTSRWGGRPTMIIGGVVSTTGWLLAMVFNDSITQVALVLIVISFGTTMLFAVGPTVLAQAVPPDRTSEAAGMMTITRQVFLGIGAQFISVILASETMAGPGGSARYPTADAFMTSMWVIVAGCVAATLMAFALPREAGKRLREPAPDGLGSGLPKKA
ncbi:MFS transporter [Sphingobium sp. Sx8-8]|uniref:MFS transporter n=1 Tax=Sphingobium sp. Sx8-8 TaxID=2933617 RepID=UPI001F56F9DD|nr:MFS transporter [Sphingobium sp. Sx8-8]